MLDIRDVLSQISSILNTKIVVISNNYIYNYPHNFELDLDIVDIKKNINSNYKGYNIYNLNILDNIYYFLFESNEFYKDKSIEIALSMIELSLDHRNNSLHNIKKLLSGYLSDDDFLLNLRANYDFLIDSYLVLIKYPKDLKDEYIEIISNSINIELIFDYNNKILVMTKDESIELSCYNIYQNILSETLTESSLSISGKIKNVKDIYYHYKNCLEGFKLKNKYKILNNIIYYDKLLLYRVVSNLDENLKYNLLNKVFNSKFNDVLDNELQYTIEEFFRNNLNITDTANSIHIHRNTLIYRIDKIQKYTNYDLRKFEDSYIFRLAWLIRKELS